MLDYCPRNMIQVEEHVRTDVAKSLSGGSKVSGSSGDLSGKHLILLTMLQNHENKTVEMVSSVKSIPAARGTEFK